MNYKKWFFALLSIMLIGTLVVAAKRFFRTPPVPAPLYFKERFEIITSLPTDSNDILLIGNSLTERFPEDLLKPGIKKRGVGSATTSNIIENIAALVRGRPSKIFLEIGFNDLYNGVGADSVCINIMEIIRRINTISSTTKIYIQSIVPAYGKYRHVNPYILQVNKNLEHYCDSSSVVFIDLYSRLGPEYTYDGVHLKLNGYKAWLEAIEPYLKN